MVIKITIVGTIQSGSTRLFNLVRLIYEKKNKTVFSTWDYNENTYNGNHDIIINKIHDTDVDKLKKFDVILLPLRNILDAAISSNKRNIDIDYKSSCIKNITLFNKFENISNYIFIYEKYSVEYIKQLCSFLHIELNTIEIIDIMKMLDKMLKSENIVKIDDYTDNEYKKTLLSQAHNTSGGISNKFIDLPIIEITNLLSNNEIKFFLEKHNYI
jgi:hypothetical protein